MQISTVGVVNIADNRQKFITLTGELGWQRLRRSAVPGILVKNRRFNLPHLSLALPLGVTPLEFRWDLWHQKTRMIALSCGIKNIAGRFFELVTKHACDGQTDGQTELRLARPR